jgi:DNA-binding Lrp family transcriptional regulator
MKFGVNRMVIGVTMIKVMPDRERSVYYAIKGIVGVLDVYHIFGEFDFFIILQAEGLRKLNHLVGEIQEIGDVTAARTILVGLDSGLQEHEPIRALA